MVAFDTSGWKLRPCEEISVSRAHMSSIRTDERKTPVEASPGWVTSPVRFAVVAILAYAIIRVPVDASLKHLSRAVLAFDLFELACGVSAFGLTFTRWYRRHWRLLIFVLGTAVVLSAVGLAILSGQTTSFFIAVMLLLLGIAALVPWGARWQLGFTAVCVAGAAVQFASAPRLGVFDVYRWIELGAAAALAQFIAVLAARYRRDVESRMEALRQSEATLWKIFEASPDIVTVTRLSDGRYLSVSEEFMNSGFGRHEPTGSTERELGIWVHDEDRTAYTRRLRETGRVRNLEASLRKENGEIIPCLLSGTVIDLGQGPSVVSLIRDISPIKRTERELLSASEEAMAASRAKTEFLSKMSHEIRTPMNAILGMADVLAESRLGAEQRKYLSIMINNGNALLDLINDILDFAKIESGRLGLEKVEFDLNDLTERVAETLAISAHQKHLELGVHIQSGVVTNLVGDPLRLRQVLVNLLGNAVKFTENGEIALEVRSDDEAHPGFLHFTVSDTGIGIPESDREKIFASYAQADASISRKYGGTGLGLAIVKQLVELMGGRIWVESESGKGSKFHFTARFDVRPASKTSEVPELSDVRVLVVDDTAINRRALSAMLAGWDAFVTCAESASVALGEIRRAIDQEKPYQVVLFDSRMPNNDGAAVIQEIRSAAPVAPVVIPMLTSDDLGVRLPLLRKMGLPHHLIKPVRRSELLDVIRSALGQPKLVPAEATPIRVGAPAKKSVRVSAERPLRILLADDSADNRLLIEAFLKKTPWHLDQAENGEVALDKFMADRYDVVIMDIQMPVMDGYTAVRKIRKWENERGLEPTPIIALTASVFDEAISKSIEVGCNTHVSKPVKRPTLLNAIREITAQNSQDDHSVDSAANDITEDMAAVRFH